MRGRGNSEACTAVQFCCRLCQPLPRPALLLPPCIAGPCPPRLLDPGHAEFTACFSALPFGASAMLQKRSSVGSSLGWAPPCSRCPPSPVCPPANSSVTVAGGGLSHSSASNLLNAEASENPLQEPMAAGCWVKNRRLGVGVGAELGQVSQVLRDQDEVGHWVCQLPP